MRGYFRLFLQGASRTFDFSGRAARAELTCYLVIAQALAALLSFAASWFLDDIQQRWLWFVLQTLAILPLPALAVRRLHDFGWSGRWSWLLLTLVIRAFVLDLTSLTLGEDIRTLIEGPLSYIDWLLTLPALVLCAILLLAPGSRGDNRFGQSMRVTMAEEASTKDIAEAGPETSDPLTH